MNNSDINFRHRGEPCGNSREAFFWIMQYYPCFAPDLWPLRESLFVRSLSWFFFCGYESVICYMIVLRFWQCYNVDLIFSCIWRRLTVICLLWMQGSSIVGSKPYTAVMIVPTGTGATIGGFAGDSLPVARAISSVVDCLITHPNVPSLNLCNLRRLWYSRSNLCFLIHKWFCLWFFIFILR